MLRNKKGHTWGIDQSLQRTSLGKEVDIQHDIWYCN